MCVHMYISMGIVCVVESKDESSDRMNPRGACSWFSLRLPGFVQDFCSLVWGFLFTGYLFIEWGISIVKCNVRRPGLGPGGGCHGRGPHGHGPQFDSIQRRGRTAAPQF